MARRRADTAPRPPHLTWPSSSRHMVTSVPAGYLAFSMASDRGSSISLQQARQSVQVVEGW